MLFYTTPTSNIPSSAYYAADSVVMSRSDSRDSTNSTSSSTSTWDLRPSSSSSSLIYPSCGRRDSFSTNSSANCAWMPSPFRSCLHNSLADKPSSYLSDDELICLSLHDAEVPVVAESPMLLQRELTTEEQIEILRQQREKEEQKANAYGQPHIPRPEAWWRQGPAPEGDRRARVVRFAQPGTAEREKQRRPSIKRRYASRRLTGPSSS